MRHGLFRQEALDFHQEKLLGDIVLVRPLSVSLLTSIAVGIALTVMGFACWGTYTRKTHVTGYLEPNKGLIKVYESREMLGIMPPQVSPQPQCPCLDTNA